MVYEEKTLKSDLFVRKPVDDVCRKINDNSSKQIILNGGRGTGKSTILYNLRNSSIGTDSPTFYTYFESATSIPREPNNLFNEEFLKHYYELKFSLKLLQNIKEKYPIIFVKYFLGINETARNLNMEMCDYINNRFYVNPRGSIDTYLAPGQMSYEILERLKSGLGIGSINVSIDRFDHINGSSAYVQNLLSEYFSMFDKTIITADDPSVSIENVREKGFDIITADYGGNIDIVRDIINRKIQEQTAYDQRKYFNLSLVTGEILERLIADSNGNISIMLKAATEAVDSYQWYAGKRDFGELLLLETQELVKQSDKMLSYSKNPPKFHL